MALTPRVCESLAKSGVSALIERGAGAEAGYPDAGYERHGAHLASRAEVFQSAEIVLQVRTLGANPEAGRADLDLLRPGQIVIGTAEPLTAIREAHLLAARGVTLLALELVPRITRAQTMDVLSSMASVAGYKAVLLAADALPKMFPLMMTAAGTVAPAKVLVLGAGVAGLQAIATAKRLGAVTSGYDIREAAREQIESLGAKAVVLDFAAASSEDRGGYARALDQAEQQRQRELLAGVIAEQDVLITTAAVPGKKAPMLVTAQMASRMAAGSVIVDLAAERGGNCELTRPGETVVHQGISILGPVNLPSAVPFHASQMFAINIAAFLKNMIRKDGVFEINEADQIVKETLVTRGGKVVHPRVVEPEDGPAPARERIVNA